MKLDAVERRCSLRTEVIVRDLLLEVEDRYFSKEVLKRGAVLSTMEEHFSSIQRGIVDVQEGNTYLTSFTQIAHENLRSQFEEFDYGCEPFDDIVVEGMADSIIKTVNKYFTGLLEADEKSNNQPLLLENVYSHCYSCTGTVWEQCELGMFNQDIINYVDKSIIENTGGNFVEVINTACESTMDILQNSIPDLISSTLHDILKEIFVAAKAYMDTRGISSKVVHDEVAPIFESDAAKICEEICAIIDHAVTAAYIQGAMSSYIFSTPQFEEEMEYGVKDKMEEITEEVRAMEI